MDAARVKSESQTGTAKEATWSQSYAWHPRSSRDPKGTRQPLPGAGRRAPGQGGDGAEDEAVAIEPAHATRGAAFKHPIEKGAASEATVCHGEHLLSLRRNR